MPLLYTELCFCLLSFVCFEPFGFGWGFFVAVLIWSFFHHFAVVWVCLFILASKTKTYDVSQDVFTTSKLKIIILDR